VRQRILAIRVLWGMRQPAGPLVAALCRILSSDDTSAGVQAIEALGEMGPAAALAVPTLLKLLNDPQIELVGHRWGPPHKAAVIRTLGKIGPEAAATLPALFAGLNSGNYFIRIETGQALARMGRPAQGAVRTRDAAWCVGITLSAVRPQAALAALPLVEICKKTWIPGGAPTPEAVRDALRCIDPDGVSPRPGGP
jgi:hypothetical protein